MALGDLAGGDAGGSASSFGGMKFGNSFFSNAGGAVNDLYAGDAAQQRGYIKAQGDWVEAANYRDAQSLATQNAQYTEMSTNIKDVMAERNIYRTISGQEAGFASSGLQESGSALDIMRSSAAEGALTRSLVQAQGQITEASYKEQATSYGRMADYATWAGNQEHGLGDQAKSNSNITAGIKGATAVASLFA